MNYGGTNDMQTEPKLVLRAAAVFCDRLQRKFYSLIQHGSDRTVVGFTRRQSAQIADYECVFGGGPTVV
ncbi:hypothetical protein PXNS11_450008 [Stutzerimonas xanthomarina]|nr:hypothetical protein PXNS11_450008 [Stutzerimonas xanthomarina]